MLCSFLFLSLFACLAIEARQNFSIELTQIIRSGKEIAELRLQQKSSKISGKFNRFIANQYPHDYVATYARVGTPEVKYVVAIETGRPDLWLMDPGNPMLNDGQKSYDPDKSSTSNFESGTFKGRSGQMYFYGALYSDIFDFTNGITFKQFFGSVHNIFDNYVDASFEADGVLGLSWTNDPSVTYKAPIVNILEGLEATKKLYTFYLGPHRKPSEGRAKGQFTPGEIDYQHCSSDIQYTPVTHFQSYVSFSIDAFAIDKFSSIMTQTAAVDSGMPILLLPKAEYDAAFELINPSVDSQTGLLTTDCGNANKLPDIKFTINKVVYAVPAKQYILDLDLSENNCAVAIGQNVDTDVMPAFVLGNAFNRQYCLIFDIDNSQIGFSEVDV